MAKITLVATLICDTLIEMMETQPFEKIKVTELIKIAGIGRSTFYDHFDSIFAAIQFIEDNFMAGLLTEESISNKLATDSEIFDGHKYIRDNMRIYRALCGPNGDPAFQARLTNRIKRLYKRKLESLPSRRTYTETCMISEYAAGGIWSLYKWWAFHEEEVSIVEVKKLTQELRAMIEDAICK